MPVSRAAQHQPLVAIKGPAKKRLPAPAAWVPLATLNLKDYEDSQLAPRLDHPRRVVIGTNRS